MNLNVPENAGINCFDYARVPNMPQYSYNNIITIIELTHSKTILENTFEIEPQPVALDFKNLSQYPSRSK